MWANPAVLLEFSNYWEPPGLWTLVGLLHALSNILCATAWAFLYKGNTIPFRGQATGRWSGSGGQPTIVTAIISTPTQSGVCLPQGSSSYQVHTTWTYQAQAPFSGLFSPLGLLRLSASLFPTIHYHPSPIELYPCPEDSSILQMRKWNLCEVKQFAHSHTAKRYS